MPSDTDSAAAWLRAELERQSREIEILSRAVDTLAGGQPADGTVVIAPPATERAAHDGGIGGAWQEAAVPWWPATPLPELPIRPAPGFACSTLYDPGLPVKAVLLFGLAGDALESRVAMACEVQRRGVNFLPVFLTDAPDHEAFDRRGHEFEYFPRAVYRTSTGQLDTARINARLMVIRRKWHIGSTLNLSAPEDLTEVSRLEPVDDEPPPAEALWPAANQDT